MAPPSLVPLSFLGRVLPAALCALSGCVVGPDYAAPSAPTATAYLPHPAALPSAGDADPRQHIEPGQALLEQWWTLLRSSELDRTLSLAIADSPTLDSARATLAQAQHAILAARGALYPQADVPAGAQRARIGNGPSAKSGGAVGNLLTIGPTVSYALDLFGGKRRQIEEQTALAEVQRYELAAAYLALTGNVVAQAIAAATAREQIRAAEDVIEVDKHNLELVRIERSAGKAADTGVLAAQSQLAADVALLPPLRQQLSAANDALTVLVGKTPAEWQPPAFDFTTLALPTGVPELLPSTLVRTRPDILAAQAQLHAASAAIGVATAQLYPSIALSASWTRQSAAMGTLFDGSTGLWSIAAGLTAPLFHGGALRAQRQEAVDAFTAQLGNYRQTVLQAFGQIADTLLALEHDAEALEAERIALDTAQRSLTLSQESYQAGAATLLDVLQAQRLFAQARIGYAKAKGQRFLDTAQLFDAMGGGWDSGHQRASGERKD